MQTASLSSHAEGHRHPADDDTILEVQFDDLDQQRQTSLIGMWLFLATEVLFFGGLITAYVVYRATSAEEFSLASRHMAVWLGFLNTVILLGSSLTMAMAVRSAQLRDHRWLVIYLIATMVLGAGFLGVKAIEYTTEYNEHLVPGLGFRVNEESHEGQPSDREVVAEKQLNPGRYEMFFVLYFFMTGLHAIHLIIGIGLVGVMTYLSYHRWFSGGGATQIEVTGLYWHFIDIVWVFLYPMLYLINVHS